MLSIAERHSGIIPADAGSTSQAPIRRLYYEDHPRGCGEHDPLPVAVTSKNGSSPRMRGALRIGRKISDPLGIIPADAGSTLCNDDINAG